MQLTKIGVSLRAVKYWNGQPACETEFGQEAKSVSETREMGNPGAGHRTASSEGHGFFFIQAIDVGGGIDLAGVLRQL